MGENRKTFFKKQKMIKWKLSVHFETILYRATHVAILYKVLNKGKKRRYLTLDISDRTELIAKKSSYFINFKFQLVL